MNQESIKEESIKEKLKKEIEILRDQEYGYVRAGLPHFNALFGRDSCIVSWQLINFDPTIAHDSLKILAQLQGKEVNFEREEEPGKIVHEWHPRPEEYKILPWPLPYYGSVDVTPLFVFVCYLYYEKTSDIAWLNNMWPSIKRALEWCKTYGDFDADHLLEYKQKNPSGLFHQGWKDSGQDHLELKPPIELVEVQGYYYTALEAGNKLALALKDQKCSQDYQKAAQTLKENFLEAFWLPKEKFFAYALTHSREPDKRIASNPGHLLFSGILDDYKKEREAVIERLFQKDMWTPFGIRTHAETNKDFNAMSYHLGSIWPHDNWIIAQGLKKYGYEKEYNKIKQALLDAYEALDKIPELYAFENRKLKEIPIACHPQAWATGALLNFLLDGSDNINLEPQRASDAYRMQRFVMSQSHNP